MSWKVRHEGSPQAVEVPSAQQVAEGLLEGLWEPSDEVMGPGEPAWTPLESHPTFAEAAAEVEPPPPRHYDDETNLDMNALIDVCLVLLIFFILTASYAALQSRIENPDLNLNKPGIAEVTEEEVQQQMVHVKAVLEGGTPVIMIEGKKVERTHLLPDLIKAKSGKARNILLLEVERNVPHEVTVFIQDAAYKASFDKVLRLVAD